MRSIGVAANVALRLTIVYFLLEVLLNERSALRPPGT